MSNSEATGGAYPAKDERRHGCLTLRTLPSFGTTCRRRCPEISGTRQEVPVAEAEAVPLLQVFTGMGTRLCPEILRKLRAPPLDPPTSLPRLPHRLHLETRSLLPGLPLLRADHTLFAHDEDHRRLLAPLAAPSEPAVLVQGLEAPGLEDQKHRLP